MTHQEAMKYAAGIAVVTLVNAMAVNHFYLLSANMGLKTRVAICSLIYKKVSIENRKKVTAAYQLSFKFK